MNGSDCGMFACKFAEYVTRDARITFTQVKITVCCHFLAFISSIVSYQQGYSDTLNSYLNFF